MAGPDASLAMRISVHADQVSCALEDQVVVLNLGDGVYYGLNAVAARVWQLIQAPRSVREVRDIIQTEYEVDEQQCTDDLLALIARLRSWNLIEVV